MTIYLDPSALGQQRPAVVARTLRYFREAGYRVAVAAELPSAPEPGSWYVTAEPAACAIRRPSLRTIYVGPPLSGRAAVARCDVSARDLAAATLEILAFDAGGPQPSG
jgi:hypothetical protein